MKRYYGVGDASWEQCIPGGVGPAALPVAARPDSGGILRLAGVGAIVPWKRWDLVLAALALLPAPVRSSVRFRHIGTAEADAAAQAWAAGLHAAAPRDGTVEWLGQQPSADALLAESDVLVVASHHEPFSIAMLEALQAGVPVLAADSGGAADIIKPGVNGWLFPSGDATALAGRIAALAANPAAARLPEDEIRRSAFRADAIADRWVRVYQNCGGAAC
jgi:glycosyltransferase involved in cell wall biosynthesis